MKSDVMEDQDESVKNSASVLLTGLIDYAGLFPPAALPLREVVRNYAEYLHSESAWMLGRLIVPMKRLEEFEQEAHEFLPRGNPVHPWRISLTSLADPGADLQRIIDFNYLHARDENAGAAVIDTIELRAESSAEIEQAMMILPPSITTYFEIPLGRQAGPLIDTIGQKGALAKVRTGGVTAELFPSTTELAKFIVRCAGERVGFKATAGLHHPLRGSYRLTYQADSPVATMHGFLNVFLASAFARFGMEATLVRALLEETSADAFQFAEDGITWNSQQLSLQRLAVARQTFSIAYGSCSFAEPVEDLKKIGLL